MVTGSAKYPGGAVTRRADFGILRKDGFQWLFDGIAHPDRITCPGKRRYPEACFGQIFTRGFGKPIASVMAAKGSDHLPAVMEVSIP